jgi:hypothetical protein
MPQYMEGKKVSHGTAANTGLEIGAHAPDI